MYTTINDFLFPIFIYAVYFCIISLLSYNPEKLATPQQGDSETLRVLNLMEEDSNSPLVEQLAPEVKDSEIENHLYIEVIITNLNKCQSRKICPPLGIKQKCGKAQKSLLSIRSEIKSLLQQDPEKVIGVIQEKLPELSCLPSAS